MVNERNFFERIYQVVEHVPRGKVTTYGDIAIIVAGGCDARFVGHALGALGARAATVPWQRVINRTGNLSLQDSSQRELLEAEGVEFDERGRVPMDRFRWAGPAREWAEKHGFQTLPVRAGAKEKEAEEDKPQLLLF